MHSSKEIISAETFLREYSPMDILDRHNVSLGISNGSIIVEHVWTVISDEHNSTPHAISGFHLIDSAFYITTKKQWLETSVLAEWNLS